jgi:virginiamycin B lyase
VWFNEHEGNAIAYFNVANSTLVEYQIPSRAKVWGNTSNPLKFALDSKGSVWFTEWTENKIGVLDSEKLNNLPLWLDVSKDTIYLDRHRQNGNNKQDGGQEEDSLLIFIHQKNYNNNKESKLKGPINMTIAGSMSPSGRLWNISSQFSENSFSFSDDDSNLHTVKLTLYPTPDLIPGNYTLTIGARYGTVTYSKMVSMIIK